MRRLIQKGVNMENKICVYAICKNELQFIENWLASMSEADYIVVLDTGSTDGTYERLLEDPRVYKVEQKIITPWRFDTARNESMKLIPEDANICVCTDFDELFESGWADILRSKWIAGKHKVAWYKYAWRHDAEGKPIKIFKYEKIHDNDNWRWVYPVHENLEYIGNERLTELNLLDLFEEVYLHHYMDDTKPRSSYLDLLEIRKQEWPQELATRNYLIQAYMHNGENLKCMQEIQETFDIFGKEINPEVGSSLYLFMGDAARALGLTSVAELAYSNAIKTQPDYVEQYLALAEIKLLKEDYHSVVKILTECLKNASRYYVWFTRQGGDELSIYDYLAVAYSHLGDYDNAFINIFKALQLAPDNLQLQENYRIIVEQINTNLKNKTENSIIRDTSPYSV